MTFTRKDGAATALTALAVLVFVATHEGWSVPLVGDSHRWAAGAIFLLGSLTCGLGSPRKDGADEAAHGPRRCGARARGARSRDRLVGPASSSRRAASSADRPSEASGGCGASTIRTPGPARARAPARRGPRAPAGAPPGTPPP